MDIDSKLRTLYVGKILFDYTDEERFLTTEQIRTILKDDYGMEVHRQTIPRDIKVLKDFGLHIEKEHSSKNRYYIDKREFEDAEIKLIMDAFMIVVILLSLIPLAFKSEPSVLVWIDWITAGIFCIDYALRWSTADIKYPARKKWAAFCLYPFTFLALMDLFAVLPVFLSAFPAFKVLKIFRLLRVLRVTRVLKVTRYSINMEIIVSVIRNSKGPLIAVGSLAVSYILVSALLVFNVEMERFNNFFEAIYWATVSLTTVGYGDITPASTAGRIVTILSSFVGVAVVALPSAIITTGYKS